MLRLMAPPTARHDRSRARIIAGTIGACRPPRVTWSPRSTHCPSGPPLPHRENCTPADRRRATRPAARRPGRAEAVRGTARGVGRLRRQGRRLPGRAAGRPRPGRLRLRPARRPCSSRAGRSGGRRRTTTHRPRRGSGWHTCSPRAVVPRLPSGWSYDCARNQWGDAEAPRLLPACSASFVGEQLPALAHAVDGWTRLARRHPDAVLDHADVSLADRGREQQREEWWRLHGTTLAPLHPEQVPALLAQCGPQSLPPALRRAPGPLVRADADRVIRWLTSPDRPNGATSRYRHQECSGGWSGPPRLPHCPTGAGTGCAAVATSPLC